MTGLEYFRVYIGRAEAPTGYGSGEGPKSQNPETLTLNPKVLSSLDSEELFSTL